MTATRSSAASARRVGSLHAADHHRDGRHRRLRRPGRGPVDAEASTRSTGIAKRSSSTGAAPPRRPICSRRSCIKGKDGKIVQARARRRRALLPAGRRHPLGRERRPRSRPATCWRASRAKRQDPRHHRRSAAGGRAVRGAQAEGPRDHHRDRRPGRIRQGLQEQAPDHRRADEKGAEPRRVPDPEGQAHQRAGRRLHREGRLLIDGNPAPHDILAVLGVEALANI